MGWQCVRDDVRHLAAADPVLVQVLRAVCGRVDEDTPAAHPEDEAGGGAVAAEAVGAAEHLSRQVHSEGESSFEAGARQAPGSVGAARPSTVIPKSGASNSSSRLGLLRCGIRICGGSSMADAR